MKKLMWGAALAVLALFALPQDNVLAQDCWLCVEYSSGGNEFHFWPGWGGGVCPNPNNEDCDVRPEGEGTSDMPGYSGNCPNSGCGPSEEDTEDLLLALADGDYDGVVSMVASSTNFVVDGKRAVVSLQACNGEKIAFIPVDGAALTAIADAIGLMP
jgi:hypothetical protein